MEVKSEMKKLMQGMAKYGYPDELIYSVPVRYGNLEHHRVENREAWLRKLEDVILDKEQYLDLWLEGKAAFLMAFNGFKVGMYPCGRKGADIRTEWESYSLYVEVARFIADYETEEKLEKGDEIEVCGEKQELLVPYGRGEKDVGVVYSKILKEAAQLPDNEVGLLFLLSDNVRIEETEFRAAVEYLEEEVSKNDTYRKLSGVLFDSGFIRLQYFYLWRNPRAERPVCDILAKKLVMLKVPPLHSKDELAKLRMSFPIS